MNIFERVNKLIQPRLELTRKFLNHVKSFRVEPPAKPLEAGAARKYLSNIALQMALKGELPVRSVLEVDMGGGPGYMGVPYKLIERIVEFKNSNKYDPNFLDDLEAEQAIYHSGPAAKKYGAPERTTPLKGSKAKQQLARLGSYKGYPVHSSGINEEAQAEFDLKNAEKLLEAAQMKYIGYHLVQFFAKLKALRNS